MPESTQQIERADGMDRALQIVKSLCVWFRCEQTRLQIERRLAREEIDRRATSGEDDVDVRQLLIDNLAEQKSLDEGWKHSSVRRAFLGDEAGESKNVTVGAERRVALAAPSAMSLAAVGRSEARATGQTVHLQGYAAVYNKVTELGFFRESIAAGAFSGVVKDPTTDCRGLINHDANLIFSRNTTGSLRLYSDHIGLKFYSDLLPGDALTDGLIARVGAGLWTGCSFAFQIPPRGDHWKLVPGELDWRIIDTVSRLFDISICSYPAYDQTSVGLLVEKPRAADVPHEPPAAARFDVDGYVRQCEREEDEAWDRNYRLESTLRRLGVKSARDKEFDGKYAKAGRILARMNAALDRHN